MGTLIAKLKDLKEEGLISQGRDYLWVGRKYEWYKSWGPFFAQRHEYGIAYGVQVGGDCYIVFELWHA